MNGQSVKPGEPYGKLYPDMSKSPFEGRNKPGPRLGQGLIAQIGGKMRREEITRCAKGLGNFGVCPFTLPPQDVR